MPDTQTEETLTQREYTLEDVFKECVINGYHKMRSNGDFEFINQLHQGGRTQAARGLCFIHDLTADLQSEESQEPDAGDIPQEVIEFLEPVMYNVVEVYDQLSQNLREAVDTMANGVGYNIKAAQEQLEQEKNDLGLYNTRYIPDFIRLGGLYLHQSDKAAVDRLLEFYASNNLHDHNKAAVILLAYAFKHDEEARHNQDNHDGESLFDRIGDSIPAYVVARNLNFAEQIQGELQEAALATTILKRVLKRYRDKVKPQQLPVHDTGLDITVLVDPDNVNVKTIQKIVAANRAN